MPFGDGEPRRHGGQRHEHQRRRHAGDRTDTRGDRDHRRGRAGREHDGLAAPREQRQRGGRHHAVEQQQLRPLEMGAHPERGDVDRDQEGAQVVQRVAGRGERGAQPVTGEDARAGDADEHREFRGLRDVVPAGRDEHRRRGQQQEHARRRNPGRAGAAAGRRRVRFGCHRGCHRAMPFGKRRERCGRRTVVRSSTQPRKPSPTLWRNVSWRTTTFAG